VTPPTNKVIVDGVTINEPAVRSTSPRFLSLKANRVQSSAARKAPCTAPIAHDQRGAGLHSAPAARPRPELRFGADGGNFSTANGFASLAGARGHFDYNAFGDQFTPMDRNQ